jgi:hypothetical protein
MSGKSKIVGRKFMDITFNSLEELYKRIKPALTTKKEQMRRNGYVYIKEEDIWNYLKEVKWLDSKNLSLYQMTCDILDTDDMIIDEYLRKKLNFKNRKVYFN